MIRLDTTTRTLEIILDAAVVTNQLAATVCYSDKSATAYTGGTQKALSNNTTAVTICAAPAAGSIRDIDSIMVYNADTVAANVTIRYNDNTTISALRRVSLAAGDTLTYTHAAGWVGGSVYGIASAVQTFAPTMAANACTISAVNSVPLLFRSATLGSGTVSSPIATPSANLVIPAGATLGTVNGVLSGILVAEMNNGGTREFAVCNMAGGLQCDERNLISTTAISASATAANVWYSTTARTSLPYRIIGYFESTQATAGQWATSASLVQSAFGEALTALSGLGYGQTQQDITSSTVKGTTYYNGGKPVTIRYTFVAAALGSRMQITIQGVSFISMQGSAATAVTEGGTFVIPPFASWVIADNSGTNTIASVGRLS